MDRKTAHDPARHSSPIAALMRQLVRFNLVGILNTVVDFCLFFLLNSLGVPYLIAQTVSYSCGIANSYLFNKYWTFGTSGVRDGEVLKFVVVNVGALCLSVFLVYLFHTLMNFSLIPAKTAATVVTMAFGFIGNRMWVFRSASGSTGP